VSSGFVRPQPQQPSQFGGSSAFSKPPSSNTASGSAFSSVIGSREDRGLRMSFGTGISTHFLLLILGKPCWLFS